VASNDRLFPKHQSRPLQYISVRILFLGGGIIAVAKFYNAKSGDMNGTLEMHTDKPLQAGNKREDFGCLAYQ
jgi:hypothetical protein